MNWSIIHGYYQFLSIQPSYQCDNYYYVQSSLSLARYKQRCTHVMFFLIHQLKTTNGTRKKMATNKNKNVGATPEILIGRRKINEWVDYNFVEKWIR